MCGVLTTGPPGIPLLTVRTVRRTSPLSSPPHFLCRGLPPQLGFSPAVSSPQKCISRGELQVSLSYQPVAQRMTVVVLKARHLPKMDITGLSGSSYLLQPISVCLPSLPRCPSPVIQAPPPAHLSGPLHLSPSTRSSLSTFSSFG